MTALASIVVVMVGLVATDSTKMAESATLAITATMADST